MFECFVLLCFVDVKKWLIRRRRRRRKMDVEDFVGRITNAAAVSLISYLLIYLYTYIYILIYETILIYLRYDQCCCCLLMIYAVIFDWLVFVSTSLPRLLLDYLMLSWPYWSLNPLFTSWSARKPGQFCFWLTDARA